MKKIGDGAEAIIYLKNDIVLKERIKKGYRLEQIDKKLRKYRTRSESSILEKAHKLGFTPRLIESDDKKMTMHMEYIQGPRLRDVLDKQNYKKLSREIGKKVALLHNNNIIHSDLTTSNMILNKQIYFIDFGLGYISRKIEDKAVDLHLLKQALESKHHHIFKDAFRIVIKSYKEHANNNQKILRRLEKVELRGRNKTKGS